MKQVAKHFELVFNDLNANSKNKPCPDWFISDIVHLNEELKQRYGLSFCLFISSRFFTMSIMMAVDLLGCTGSTEERAALLHKTIQLAAELKSTMGNMFGFAAVMRALELPQVWRLHESSTDALTNYCMHSLVMGSNVTIVRQISRLEQTWVTLRQRHTEGAILYEKKLKPFMKNMNDGKGEFKIISKEKRESFSKGLTFS